MKTFALLLLPTAALAGSLCETGEQALFSCSTGKAGKLVSLCASPHLDKSAGYLQYRFGKPGKIELAFPADRAGSLEKFRYAHYFRFQVDRTTVSFSNDGFDYSLFTHYDGEEKPAVQAKGVWVTNKAQPDKEIEILCKGQAVSRLEQLENVLPCDTQSEIASCGE